MTDFYFKGVYLSVFAKCCVVFYKRKRARETVRVYLLVTTGLRFILITMRCFIDTYRCIITLNDVDLDPGPPNSFLGVLETSCWILITMTADVFIVFRALVVWNRRWLISIIPSLLVLANSVIAVFAIVFFISPSTTWWSPVDWMNAFISLTLCINVICTGLIAFRIIQVHRQVAWIISRTSVRPANIRILSVVVESAAIYTAVLVATLVMARLRGFAIIVLMDCLSPTIVRNLPLHSLRHLEKRNEILKIQGLIFSSIIIRIGRGTSYESTMDGPPTILNQHRANVSSLEFAQLHTGISDFQITLERTTRVPVKMTSSLTSDEVDGPEIPCRLSVPHTDLGHAHVLVFVLDTATSERFSEAKEELSRQCSGGHSGLLLCRFGRQISTESYDDINTCRKVFDVACGCLGTIFLCALL
ncbi:hypothetical protein K438DRAFT_1984376 [Mycena galopus ATCC 62051]|nr:hypothetical protein K438DRAFT_1984376 [Mycena galopus ATCC 62051]